MTILYVNPEYKNLWESITKQKFVRDEGVQREYDYLLEDLKSKNINVEDYTLAKFFWNNERVVIVRNEYPYKLPDTFRHDIVWMLDNLSSEEINEAVNRFYEADKIVACFINEFTRQSVRKVKHAHVIVDV